MSRRASLGMIVGGILMVIVEFTREGYRWVARP